MRNISACFFFILLLPSLTASAERNDYPDIKTEDDFRRRAPEIFGIPEDSRLYKTLQKHVEDGLAASREFNAGKVPKDVSWQLPLQYEPGPIPIRRHYRGKAGIRIPSPAEFRSPLKSQKDAILAELKQELEAASPEIQRELLQAVKFDELPDCETADTLSSSVPNDKLSIEEKKHLIVDILHVRRGSAPANPAVVFGKGTLVLEYGSDPENRRDDWWAEKIGGRCLPFRLRATRSMRYLYHGSNALRNYDKNPDGKGVLVEQSKPYRQGISSGETLK